MEKSRILQKERNWKEKYFEKGLKEKLKPVLSKSNKHLDFGCGIGTLPYLLAMDYPRLQVYGYDIDMESIHIAQVRYIMPNLIFKCKERLSENFDTMSCFNVIHHLEEVEKFLEIFYKRLNPNGKIIVKDFRKVSKKRFKEWYDKKIEEGAYKDSFEESYKKHNKWSIKGFQKLAEKIGFKTLKMEKDKEYWFFFVGKKVK